MGKKEWFKPNLNSKERAEVIEFYVEKVKMSRSGVARFVIVADARHVLTKEDFYTFIDMVSTWYARERNLHIFREDFEGLL